MIQFQRAATQATEATRIEADPIKRMDDAMLEIDGCGQTVDREAISLMGFSSAEID